MAASPTIPPEYAALVDDAALFPPREAALEDAVAEHRAARGGPYGALLGPFLVDDRRLPALLGHLGRAGDRPLPITVVVTGGAGAVQPAVQRVTGGHGGAEPALVDLRGVEVALRDLDDLPGSARRVVAAHTAAVEQGLGPEVPVHVELPLTHVPDPTASPGWRAALDVVASAGLRLTLRTGGSEQHHVPSASVLAAAVDAALDRELAFTCTGGLHHAVRHRASTGLEHHGFLNLLVGTARSWDGAGHDEVVAVLEERDPEVVLAAVRAADTGLTSARRWFTSFGCCSVADPLADLTDLELVPRVP